MRISDWSSDVCSSDLLLSKEPRVDEASASAAKPTVLFDLHRELGGKMVPFAGYALPVQYPAGIMAEHQHTREAATLFDVSHMGQLRLDGADRAATLEALVPVDVAGLARGRPRYGDRQSGVEGKGVSA